MNYFASLISICTILISLYSSILSTAKNAPEPDIEELNHSLIFDLYMNFELAQRHRNLSVMVDYFPNFVPGEINRLTVTTDNAGNKERIAYKYNEKGKLQKLSYQVDRGDGKVPRFYYQFLYEDNQLTGASIAGKKKLIIKYNDEGLVSSIRRIFGRGTLEYTFIYDQERSKADIKLKVITNGKSKPSSRRYFAAWNSDFRLTDFRFDVFTSSDISYGKKGEVVSFYFDRTNSSDNKLTWNYIFDKKGNWIKKEFKNSSFTRNIMYQ